MGYVLFAWWRRELSLEILSMQRCFPPPSHMIAKWQSNKKLLTRATTTHAVQHWATVYDFSHRSSLQNHQKRTRTRQSCSHNSVEMKLHAPVRFIFIYRLHHNSKLHWQDGHALQVVHFTCLQHATSAMFTKTSKHASEPFQKYVDVTGSYRHNPDNLATFKTEWQKRAIEESLLTREKANAQPWLRTN